MFIALSLIHGGPGPMCFSEALYQRLSGSPLTCQLTVDDIQDTLVQDVLKKVIQIYYMKLKLITF